LGGVHIGTRVGTKNAIANSVGEVSASVSSGASTQTHNPAVRRQSRFLWNALSQCVPRPRAITD